MKLLKGLRICLGIALALGLVTAFAATSSASPEEQIEMFHKAAKADGEVIFHYMGASKAMDPVLKAFRKRFPDIDISIVSIGASAIGTRLIAEHGAGKISIDVGTALLSYILPVVDRDLLVQYDWVKSLGVDPNRVSFGNRLVDFLHAPRVWVYNTNMIKKADAPKSWEDVLDPKWKGGKIAVRAAPSGFAWLWPAWKKDKEKVIAFLKEFVKQDVIPGKRDAMVANRIATGECPLGTISSTNAVRLLDKGAPIAVAPMGTTASDAGVFYIPKGAPHPKAAMLLMAWLISKDGVAAIKEAGFGPASPPDASPIAKLLADSGVPFIPIKSAEDVKEYSGVFADTVMKLMNFVPK